MGGGKPPSDSLLHQETMSKVVKDPKAFIMAIPLAPDYRFSVSEVTKFEESMNDGPSLDRVIRQSVVVWTPVTEGFFWKGREG